MMSTGTYSPSATHPIESEATRWLDEIEMSAWLAYIETHGDLLTALENDLAATSLTLGDYQVFVYLTRR